MSFAKKELFRKLSDAVVEMEEQSAIEASEEVISGGCNPFEAIEKGLADGMQRAGVLFEEEEYFIPELLVCADVMNAGINVLAPHIEKSGKDEEKKIVFGVVQGDTHDIGKNLVKLLLETGGFEVIDLGRDVPPKNFIDKALEVNADAIAMSTLMTTTMGYMKEVIELLKREKIRERFKVFIGGGPISQKFANEIGADGYAGNATEAVRLIREQLLPIML
jgi:corrinoid protein of di/trimethylamine methyltransferase